MHFIDENHFVCIKHEHKSGKYLQCNHEWEKCREFKKEMTVLECV